MDSLYNIKFDPSIDMKVYSPVYLIAPIGAAMDPMGFNPAATGGSKAAAGGGISTVPFIVFVILCIAAVAALWFMEHKKVQDAEDETDDLNRQIAAASEINQIIAEHDAAERKAIDVLTMSAMTRHNNEQALEFINNLEQALPTNCVIDSFTSNDENISIPGKASSYDDITEFIMNLKKIECIDDVFVSSLSSMIDEKSGTAVYAFSLTCVYNPLQLDNELLNTEE